MGISRRVGAAVVTRTARRSRIEDLESAIDTIRALGMIVVRDNRAGREYKAEVQRIVDALEPALSVVARAQEFDRAYCILDPTFAGLNEEGVGVLQVATRTFRLALEHFDPTVLEPLP